MMKACLKVVAALVVGVCPHALAGETDSATVPVTVEVLPFAEVSLSESTMSVTLDEVGGTFEQTVGAEVRCNVPVDIAADVTPPEGAPGTWTASTDVTSINQGGIHAYASLLRIRVENYGANGGTWQLALQGDSAADVTEVITPPMGTAIVTVIPQ